ncbi:hypothetical protein KP509_38G059300 [Ceratopteris richardii]|nr:hypothetical protein KP509_38G059300 [Ceratopteris richardii]
MVKCLSLESGGVQAPCVYEYAYAGSHGFPLSLICSWSVFDIRLQRACPSSCSLPPPLRERNCCGS